MLCVGICGVHLTSSSIANYVCMLLCFIYLLYGEVVIARDQAASPPLAGDKCPNSQPRRGRLGGNAPAQAGDKCPNSQPRRGRLGRNAPAHSPGWGDMPQLTAAAGADGEKCPSPQPRQRRNTPTHSRGWGEMPQTLKYTPQSSRMIVSCVCVRCC